MNNNEGRHEEWKGRLALSFSLLFLFPLLA